MRSITEIARGIKGNIPFYRKLRLAKLIISHGMLRSGSTLLFNLIRNILLTDPNCVLYANSLTLFERQKTANTYLLKTHQLDGIKTLRANKIYYCYRDVRDALVSYHRKFGYDLSIDFVRINIQSFENAKPKSNLSFRYETMILDLECVINKVSKDLNIPIDANQAKFIIADVNKTPEQFNAATTDLKYCETTLISKNHKTKTKQGDWKHALPKSLQKKINREFKTWFIENEYEI